MGLSFITQVILIACIVSFVHASSIFTIRFDCNSDMVEHQNEIQKMYKIYTKNKNRLIAS